MLPTEAPPADGSLEFEVSAAPVSFQASARQKAPVVAAIRARTAACQYLLSGDVKVAIQWHVSERTRYESDASADVDNIIKPILDGLTGPDGIFIDDCQVQEITCYWTGRDAGPEALQIELRAVGDEYVSKQGLIFLDVGRGLFFPLNGDIPPPLLPGFADAVLRRVHEKEPYLRPIQRLFHKSRLRGFRTVTVGELRSRAGIPPLDAR